MQKGSNGKDAQKLGLLTSLEEQIASNPIYELLQT
jgi:hypothetical protein